MPTSFKSTSISKSARDAKLLAILQLLNGLNVGDATNILELAKDRVLWQSVVRLSFNDGNVNNTEFPVNDV